MEHDEHYQAHVASLIVGQSFNEKLIDTIRAELGLSEDQSRLFLQWWFQEHGQKPAFITSSKFGQVFFFSLREKNYNNNNNTRNIYTEKK